MAHAAVTCLIDALEHLLRVASLVIDIQNKKRLDGDKKQRAQSLQYYADNYKQILRYKQSNNWYSRPLNYAPKIIMSSEPEVRNRLRKFNAESLPTRITLYLLCQRVIEVQVFCRHLGFLLTFLKDSSDICDDREKLECLERGIAELAYRTEDFVEEFLFDNSVELKVLNFVTSVSNADPETVEEESIPILTAVQTIIDGKHGVYRDFQKTFEEIDLIKREVGKMYDELSVVTGNKQSGENDATKNLPPHTWNRDNEVIGLDDDFMLILDKVIRVPSGLEMVTIVGMGGIGKTTLARRVFEYPLSVHHFYIRAWVTVSQVYRVRDLLLGLLRSVTLLTDEVYQKSNGQLAEHLYRNLKGKRYLIVMDDVWSTKTWEDVKRCFPDDKNGSRIVLTTRLKNVADYVNPNCPPHCMSLLEINESWNLLKRKVFGDKSCPLELVDVGIQIARKCQGLPLAIVVVAGILSRIIKTGGSWNGIANSVNSLVITDPEECLEILALSYNHLPHHLKACFLYMGAFPEDCEIEVQKLINLWVAEGFLEKRTSKNSEGELVIHSLSVNLEQEAECYLEDLIDRSLVLVGKRSFSGKIRTCRIHDILRELCLREAQKEKFMHMIKRDSQGFPSGISNQRRISFSSDFWGDLNSIPPMLYVRSFLCFSLGSGFIPDFMFFQLGFKLLRVLDIVFLRFEYFPVQLLKLVHLRYLAFTVTYELPVAVSKLRYLQTLIIHGPWIRRESWESTTLLLEYWNMPWLRCLHMTEACCLGIPFIDKRNFISRRISCLQKLSTITFASCTFKVFASMPSLKKLGICETKVDYSTDGPSKCLSNLLHLKKLEELKCTFYVQTRESRCISSWNFPSYLRKLTLSWSYMPWENMTHIAKLVHLEVLKLKNHAFQGTEWEPSEESFPRLKHLLIENNNLAHWIVTSIHFPSLEHLALRSCPFLEEIPFAVGEIPTLQLIEVHYCSKSAELSAKEIQEQIDGLDVDIRSGWQENNDRNYV